MIHLKRLATGIIGTSILIGIPLFLVHRQFIGNIFLFIAISVGIYGIGALLRGEF